MASMHVAFGFALIGAVVGEFTGADRGMGLLIAHSQGTFDTAGVFAGMVDITVMALLAEGLIGLLEKRLTAWRPKSTSDSAAGA
jgi:NitT/TauT family transport system permease protein